MTDSARIIQFLPDRRRAFEVPSALVGEVVGVLLDITPLNSHQSTGVYRMRSWFSDSCIFSQLEADAVAVRKTRPQVANGEHLVWIHRYLRGHVRGRIGDHNIDRDPGSIYLLDQAHQLECVQTPAATQSIMIPKSLIGYTPDQHAPLLHLPSTDPIGRVIFGLFDDLFDGLLAKNEISAASFDQLLACARIALGTEDRASDIRRQLRNALSGQISSHIERHLDHWDLSVKTLLRDFGVSRASLYRMFEHHGGVRQYISDRRLVRAVLDITKHPLRRGEISNAAEKWGFSSNANFNRSVKRKFGVAPGSLVNLSTGDRERVIGKHARLRMRDRTAQSVGHLTGSRLLLPG